MECELCTPDFPGWQADWDMGDAVPCVCADARGRAHLLSSAQIPTGLKPGVVVDLKPVHGMTSTEIASWLKAKLLIQKVLSTGGFGLITGGAGTGKSVLLAHAALLAVKAGRDVIFCDASDPYRALEVAGHGTGGDAINAGRDRLLRTDFVVIDNIGQQRNPTAFSAIRDILSLRESSAMPTLITSRLTLPMLSTDLGASLVDVLSANMAVLHYASLRGRS